jgi:DNA gyrase subunit A
LEGLKIAIDNIDEVVRIIRSSASTDDARVNLMERFGLSKLQANAILDMKLSRLTGLERDKIIAELEELYKKIEWYKEILANEHVLFGVIKDELKEIKEKYGDERKTDIVNYDGDIDIEDLIADDDMVVTLTTENYIKRTPLDLYRKQKRGGKGINAINPKENDYVKNIFVASSHTLLLLFTSYGKVYWIKVHQLPEAARNSRGKPIINLVNIEKDEKIAAVLPIKEFVEGEFIMMGTKNGTVKKTDIMEYKTQRTNGKKAIKLNEGDELIEVKITKGNDDVVLATKKGLSIRFNENDVRAMGRVAAGVRGIRINSDDEVVTMDVIEEGTTLLSITDKGIGKRTPVEDYRLQSRGGKGIITIKTSEENGYVVGVLKVNQNDEAMLITSNGQAIRIPVSGISVIGRNTKGVRLFKVENGELVVSVTKIIDPEDLQSESGDMSDPDNGIEPQFNEPETEENPENSEE